MACHRGPPSLRSRSWSLLSRSVLVARASFRPVEPVTLKDKKNSTAGIDLADGGPGNSAPAAIGVFIVDDHPLFTSVLSEVLTESGEFTVVGTAGEGFSAFERVKSAAPEILVLDLRLPGCSGLELLRMLREANVPTKIVICSGVPDAEAIEMSYGLGARCFVEKKQPIAELVAVLRKVAAGEEPVSERAAAVLRDALRRGRPARRLSGGELEILRRMATGQTTKQIAAGMGLSIAAVYKARSRIGQQFSVRKAPDVRRLAVRLGLIH